jgi:hypothetical protein
VQLKSRLQTAQHTARESLITAKHKSKQYYDKHTEQLSIKVGHKVLLYDETVRRGRSRKLSFQWLGPYEVISKEGINATIKRGRIQKVHLNMLNLSISFCTKRNRNFSFFQMLFMHKWITTVWIIWVLENQHRLKN